MTSNSGVQGPNAPAGLAVSGKKLWRSVADEYALDTHEELLLKEACRCADRLVRLEKEAAGHDVTTVNKRGDLVAHPALSEARQQQIVLSRLLASLRLPSGEIPNDRQRDDGLNRPQRRGASRGAYRTRPLGLVNRA